LIAQLNATIAGFGIAVLPHFMATAHPELRQVAAGRGQDHADLLAVDACRQQGFWREFARSPITSTRPWKRARAVQRGV